MPLPVLSSHPTAQPWEAGPCCVHVDMPRLHVDSGSVSPPGGTSTQGLARASAWFWKRLKVQAQSSPPLPSSGCAHCRCPGQELVPRLGRADRQVKAPGPGGGLSARDGLGVVPTAGQVSSLREQGVWVCPVHKSYKIKSKGTDICLEFLAQVRHFFKCSGYSCMDWLISIYPESRCAVRAGVIRQDCSPVPCARSLLPGIPEAGPRGGVQEVAAWLAGHSGSPTSSPPFLLHKLCSASVGRSAPGPEELAEETSA